MVIVDDEPAAIVSLKSILDEFDELEVVATVGNGYAALEALKRYQPDIVFLDIEMPGINGFEVASKTAHFLHHLVFVTAYDQYALDAFSTHAIDY
ncbi:MAG: response regulator, partial [Myxococcota bacterium]